MARMTRDAADLARLGADARRRVFMTADGGQKQKAKGGGSSDEEGEKGEAAHPGLHGGRRSIGGDLRLSGQPEVS